MYHDAKGDDGRHDRNHLPGCFILYFILFVSRVVCAGAGVSAGLGTAGKEESYNDPTK